MRALIIAAAAILALTPVAAQADIINIPLSVSNILPAPGPYGNVQINLTSPTTATITFTTTADYVFIDTGVAAVNVNATSWTLSGLSGGPGFQDNGSIVALDGWGSFNQTFKQDDGFADGVTMTTFILTDTSGTWASASAVLINNAAGQEVGAHIAQVSTSGQCTGFAAGSTNETSSSNNGSGGECINPGTHVPEPMTLAMFGTMLLGFGAIRYLRRG